MLHSPDIHLTKFFISKKLTVCSEVSLFRSQFFRHNLISGIFFMHILHVQHVHNTACVYRGRFPQLGAKVLAPPVKFLHENKYISFMEKKLKYCIFGAQILCISVLEIFLTSSMNRTWHSQGPNFLVFIH